MPNPAAGVAAVEVSGLVAGYGRRQVLGDVSLHVTPGELVALVGPNGAGKSTLLKVLAGLLRPIAGTVTVLGAPPGGAPHRLAYLPQAEAVDWSFPVSVRDVVIMGLYPRAGWFRPPRPADHAAADRALTQVGLAALADRQVGELSGGQQRRAFLARALAQEPELYLLDEPVTGVDAATEEALMDILAAECAGGRTVLASTHDLAGVAEHFSRLISLNGSVVADGPSVLARDRAVLRATYGGHLLDVGDAVLLDDPHHRPGAGVTHGHRPGGGRG